MQLAGGTRGQEPSLSHPHPPRAWHIQGAVRICYVNQKIEGRKTEAETGRERGEGEQRVNHDREEVGWRGRGD